MTNLGVHLIIDAWNCPADLLNDVDAVRQALLEAAEAGGATLIDVCTHQFSPQGVTATATLAESHIAIHTWPEYGYFGADAFFCGGGDPYAVRESLRVNLRAGAMRTTELKRGIEGISRPLEAGR